MKEQPPSDAELALHEWCAVVAILSFLCFLTITAVFEREGCCIENGPVHHLKSPVITVCIEGAVEFPGEYNLPIGSSVFEAIALASPRATADMRRIKKDAKIRQGQRILVKEQKKIEKRRLPRNMEKPVSFFQEKNQIDGKRQALRQKQKPLSFAFDAI